MDALRKCIQCGHNWNKRLRSPEPKQCPSCLSRYWNKPKLDPEIKEEIILEKKEREFL